MGLTAAMVHYFRRPPHSISPAESGERRRGYFRAVDERRKTHGAAGRQGRVRLRGGNDLSRSRRIWRGSARVLRVAFEMREAVEAAPRPFFDQECRPRWRDVAGRVARRFSAAAGDLALVDNVTDGVNAVLRALSLRPGDEILTTSMTYGALARAARRIAEEKGADVIEAPIPFPAPSWELCVEATRATLTPRTRLAIFDHVTSPTALVLPIAEMARACRDRGVMVLADGAHARETSPLDIPDVGADWYVGNLHKWYFAPRGCGFLWAHPDRRERLAPTVLSWDIDKPFHAQLRMDRHSRSVGLAVDAGGVRFHGPIRGGRSQEAQP